VIKASAIIATKQFVIITCTH